MARGTFEAPWQPPGKNNIRKYLGPGPNVQGILMIDTFRGKLRVRKWPRKRPGKRHPINEFWSEWLSECNVVWKYCAPFIQQTCMEATRGTQLMPRDLFIMQARGTLAMIDHEDGTSVWPGWMVIKVSDALDAFGEIPGMILVRSPEGWVAIPAGIPGQMLSTQGETAPPQWVDPPSGGGGGSPPSLSHFPIHVGTDNAEIAQAPGQGIVIRRHSSTSEQHPPMILMERRTPPAQYQTGLTAISNLTQGQMEGIWLRNTSNSRLLAFMLRHNTTLARAELTVRHWTHLDTQQAAPHTRPIFPAQTAYLRVVDDGDDLHFQSGAGPAAWTTLHTEPLSDWIGDYDQIGIGIRPTSTAGDVQSAHFHHWTDGAVS